MKYDPPTDYATFKEIMAELLVPIDEENLDLETLKNLYESKLVYLENLRVKCFKEINKAGASTFNAKDYALILKAIHQTNHLLHDLILTAVSSSLIRRVF